MENCFIFTKIQMENCPAGRNIHHVPDENYCVCRKATELELASITLADVEKDIKKLS